MHSRVVSRWGIAFAALVATAQTGPLCGQARQRPVDPELPSVLIETPRSSDIASNLNFGVTVMGAHDSASGWYSLMTPIVAYNFSQRFSADVSMPVYFYRLAESETPGQAPPGTPVQGGQSFYSLQQHKFDPGDVLLAGHVTFVQSRAFNTTTGSVTLPSGNSDDGLSTGRVTFDFDNHYQRSVRNAALVVDVGGGDSSNLVDPLVRRNYSSLGPLAHFQTGLMFALPFHGLFQSVAYEQLPLGDSKIYTTLTRPGFPNRTVITGRSVSEDNGFTSSLAIPVNPHVTVLGYYSRSLRLHLDSVGMGVTFGLRGLGSRRNVYNRYSQGDLLK